MSTFHGRRPEARPSCRSCRDKPGFRHAAALALPSDRVRPMRASEGIVPLMRFAAISDAGLSGNRGDGACVMSRPCPGHPGKAPRLERRDTRGCRASERLCQGNRGTSASLVEQDDCDAARGNDGDAGESERIWQCAPDNEAG